MWVNASEAIPGSSAIGNTSGGNEKMNGISRITALKIDKRVSLDIWHQRLRHSSMQATKIVSGVDLKKDTEILNKCCDVCQRAKQTENKFSVSDFRASDAFELIHCDLWGPYRNVSSCRASYFFYYC